MQPLLRAAVLAIGIAPAVAGAQVFKCDAGGRTVYQAAPCPGGQAVDTQAPSFGGSAHDPVKEIRRIEADRERRKAAADADRRYDAALDRIDKAHCNRLANNATRYREHERAGGSLANWYGAERRAAEARYDRECR